MLSLDQLEFYNRWLQKADLIEDNDIGSVIDKYITLYINYNFLYNLVPILLARLNGTRRQLFGDKQSATTKMVDFIGATVLLNHLDQEHINNLLDAMPHFNICLDKGVPRPRRDQSLIQELRANDAIKANALMIVLYHIRCNIIHGEKGLDQYQTRLVVPATKLLRNILPLVYEKVNI